MLKIVLTGLVLILLASPALAATQDKEIQDGSKGIFNSILRIILKWIFPVGASYCFLHGIVSKGVKRGEWDMAAICTIASIALALFPKLLATLFGIDLQEVM